MSGDFDAVQQHVHAADAQHGSVEVVAVEHAGVEVFPLRRVGQDRGVLFADVLLRCCDQEPCGAAGRVADLIRRLWGDHVDHQLDDVSGVRELAV